MTRGPVVRPYCRSEGYRSDRTFGMEDRMPNAAEHRTMAAEERRLAGMCRSPGSREEHCRRENGLLALADNEEWLERKLPAQPHTDR